ncbi:unnamed protein product [Spodoptera exigua]|nr:unnamed protein product [Spodoptera exigua]
MHTKILNTYPKTVIVFVVSKFVLIACILHYSISTFKHVGSGNPTKLIDPSSKFNTVLSN